MNPPGHKLLRTLVLGGASLTSAVVGCGGQISGPQGSPSGAWSTSSSAPGSTPSYSTSTSSAQVGSTTLISDSHLVDTITLTTGDASAGVDARAAADAALDATDAADVSYSIIYPPIR
jgi:hypothetical protein